MVYYVGRNPDFAEKHGFALTNAAWTYSLMAVTDEQYYNENEVYTVAVPKENEALKQHIAFNYPQWRLVSYDSSRFQEYSAYKNNGGLLCGKNRKRTAFVNPE